MTSVSDCELATIATAAAAAANSNASTEPTAKLQCKSSAANATALSELAATLSSTICKI